MTDQIRNIYDAVFRSEQAKANASDPAVLNLSEQDSLITYERLRALVDAIRADADIKAGQNVALVMPNSLELIVALLAIWSQGAAAVPLNPAYTSAECKSLFEDLGVRKVFILPGADKVKATLKEASSGLDIFETVLNKNSLTKASGLEVDQDNRTALYLHTSGTTGKPKAVPLRHSNLLRGARNVAETYNLGAGNRTYLLQVLFHIHGIVAALLAPLITGGSIAIPPGGALNGSRAWFDFSEHGCDWVTGTPSILQTLLAAPCPSPMPQIRFIRSCSSPLLPTVFDALRKRFACPIVEAYAMTEASHQMCSNTLEHFSSGTVGPESGATKICIWKDGNKACELGEPGEVCVSGDNVMNAYEGVSEETNEKAFWHGTDERGNEARWFCTGDRGILSKDGHRSLTLVGRLSEIINRGGEKISPPEVDEAMMLASGEVKEAACFAVQNDFYGQEVEAAVVLKPGSKLTEAEIQKLLEERLAGFKIPKRIHFCEDKIPKGPTGKIQRKNLAQVFTARQEQNDTNSLPPKDIYSIIDEALGLESGQAKDRSYASLLELGADSMSLVTIAARMTRTLGVSPNMSTLFSFPSVQKLAQMAEAGSSNALKKGDSIFGPAPFSLLSLSDEKLHEVCRAASVDKGDLEDAFPLSASQKMVLDTFAGDKVDSPLIWMLNRYTVARGTDRARLLQALRILQEHEASFRWTIANVSELGWITLQQRQNAEDCVEQLQCRTAAEADRILGAKLEDSKHVTGARTAKIFLIDIGSDLQLAILESHAFTEGQSRTLILDSLTKAYKGEALDPYPPYQLFVSQHPEGKDDSDLLAFWEKEKMAARDSEGADWKIKEKSFIPPQALINDPLEVAAAESIPGPFGPLTFELGMTLPLVTEAVYALSLSLYFAQQDEAFARGHVGYDRGTSMRIAEPSFSGLRAYTAVYLPNYLLVDVAKSSLWAYMQYFRAVTQLRERNACINSSSSNADHSTALMWRFKVDQEAQTEAAGRITSLIEEEVDEKLTIRASKPCFVSAWRKGKEGLSIAVSMQQKWLEAQQTRGAKVGLSKIFARSLQFFAEHHARLHKLSWQNLRDQVMA